jgi:hypothetical protein
MLETFLSLSPVLIIALCVVLPVLVAAPIVRAILKKTIKTSGEDATVLAPTISFVGTAFALLLAFVIVAVWSDQREKQQVLFAEITTIENILIESKTIAPETAPELNKRVLDYLQLVLKFEIRKKAPIGGEQQTERQFEETLAVIDKLEKSMQADPQKRAQAQSFFEETREWIKNRETRVNKASVELDDVFTGILILLALLTVILVALLPSTSSPWAKWTQTLGVAFAVGLILSLVFYIASDSFTSKEEEQQIERVRQALGGADKLKK